VLQKRFCQVLFYLALCGQKSLSCPDFCSI
jgi:hypothetical protein